MLEFLLYFAIAVVAQLIGFAFLVFIAALSLQ